ncbi:uncharacterized protein IUM83_02553 [Phytophthora cinnamomi]|uniref:uncharacterized protein n=1 Tax=Phytophthora cinnamomi TaxID=4785 RepID=UPI00355ABDF1|nr:hypothetical protein IUM83_02553 [Phytophthora cinnamomi]
MMAAPGAEKTQTTEDDAAPQPPYTVEQDAQQARRAPRVRPVRLSTRVHPELLVPFLYGERGGRGVGAIVSATGCAIDYCALSPGEAERSPQSQAFVMDFLVSGEALEDATRQLRALVDRVQTHLQKKATPPRGRERQEALADAAASRRAAVPDERWTQRDEEQPDWPMQRLYYGPRGRRERPRFRDVEADEKSEFVMPARRPAGDAAAADAAWSEPPPPHFVARRRVRRYPDHARWHGPRAYAAQRRDAGYPMYAAPSPQGKEQGQRIARTRPRHIYQGPPSHFAQPEYSQYEFGDEAQENEGDFAPYDEAVELTNENAGANDTPDFVDVPKQHQPIHPPRRSLKRPLSNMRDQTLLQLPRQGKHETTLLLKKNIELLALHLLAANDQTLEQQVESLQNDLERVLGMEKANFSRNAVNIVTATIGIMKKATANIFTPRPTSTENQNNLDEAADMDWDDDGLFEEAAPNDPAVDSDEQENFVAQISPKKSNLKFGGDFLGVKLEEGASPRWPRELPPFVWSLLARVSTSDPQSYVMRVTHKRLMDEIAKGDPYYYLHPTRISRDADESPPFHSPPPHACEFGCRGASALKWERKLVSQISSRMKSFDNVAYSLARSSGGKEVLNRKKMNSIILGAAHERNMRNGAASSTTGAQEETSFEAGISVDQPELKDLIQLLAVTKQDMQALCGHRPRSARMREKVQAQSLQLARQSVEIFRNIRNMYGSQRR